MRKNGFHSPPFCTYERTNSSAFSSRTSSISSRMASTSSDISLCRSATSVSTEPSTSSVSSRVRVAFCCPPVSLVATCPPLVRAECVLPPNLLVGTDIRRPPTRGAGHRRGGEAVEQRRPDRRAGTEDEQE